MQNKVINETKSAEEIKFFDPEKHKVDPNLRVAGRNNGVSPPPGKDGPTIARHSWEETMSSIDIDIPVTVPVDSSIIKDDIQVEIRSNYNAILMRIVHADSQYLISNFFKGFFFFISFILLGIMQSNRDFSEDVWQAAFSGASAG